MLMHFIFWYIFLMLKHLTGNTILRRKQDEGYSQFQHESKVTQEKVVLGQLHTLTEENKEAENQLGKQACLL